MKNIFCLLFVLFVLPSAAFSQSLWTGPQPLEKGVQLELMNGRWTDQFDIGQSATYNGFLTLAYMLNEKVGLSVELPFTSSSIDSELSDLFPKDPGGFKIGNPRIGADYRPQAKNFIIGVGFRIPMVSADDVGGAYSLQFARIIDYGRATAFTPDALSMDLKFDGLFSLNDRFDLRVRVNPEIWVPAGDNKEDGQSTLIVRHALQLWTSFSDFRVGAGLAGVSWLTKGDTDIVNYTGGVNVTYMSKVIQPGLVFRLPLDQDLKDTVDGIIGINLTVPIN